MILVTMMLAAVTATASCEGPSGRAGADDEVRPLFEDGRSAWAIVVAADAPRPVRYAAGEFAAAVKRISGATLGIVTPAEAPKRNLVVLSATGAEFDDRFGWKEEPGRIELCGNSPRGALFAVYAYLRDELDCRWYWPGETGEFLPKLDRFEVKSGKKDYSPKFRYRELSICGNCWRHRHPATERWFPKVFLNSGANTPEVREELGLLHVISEHFVSLPILKDDRRRRLFEEHPEWFALRNGKRDIDGIAGCWSNPGFTGYIVSNMVARLRRERVDVANLYVADVVPRCECPACTAEPDRSARWWKYYAKLIDAVHKELPDQRFAGLAYQEYRPVPSMDVKGLEYIEYCQYNRCYFHAFGEKDCAYNRSSMAEFDAWNRRATMGLYGYEFDVYNRCLYYPFWRVFEDEMRAFAKMGLTRVKTEYSVDLHRLERDPAFPKAKLGQLVNRLASYCWAMSAFDPGLGGDDLVADFCRHVYGAGAEKMLGYHLMMAERWGAMKSHVTYFGSSPLAAAPALVDPATAAKGETLLREAAAAAAGDGRAMAEIRLDAEAFANWKQAAEEARSGKVTVDLAVRDEGDPFAAIGWLATKTMKGEGQPTKFKLYRGRDGLHILAECRESDPEFVRGETENDRQTWETPSIEMFLDTGDGASRQIVVSPAGGVWDAKDGDLKWNSGATVRPGFEDGGWRLEITLPYAGLGAEPKPGDEWKLMLIRNPRRGSAFAPTGWPRPLHRDFGSAATLRFR